MIKSKEIIFDIQQIKPKDSTEKTLSFIGNWLEYFWLGLFILFSLMLMSVPIPIFFHETIQ